MDDGEAVLETGEHFSAFPAFEIDEIFHRSASQRLQQFFGSFWQ